MAFTFQEQLDEQDPECVANFDRQFEHTDWIDGDTQTFLLDTPSNGGQSVVPYLPLNELRRPAAAPQTQPEVTQ